MTARVTFSLPNSARSSPTIPTTASLLSPLAKNTVDAIVSLAVACTDEVYNKIGSIPALVEGSLCVWEKLEAAVLPVSVSVPITDEVVRAFTAGYTVYFRLAARDTTDAAIAATGRPAYHTLLCVEGFMELALAALEIITIAGTDGNADVAAST